MGGLPPTYRYRSLFWPLALILLGVVALLVNTGVVPADQLYRLDDLWPLLLVVLGLELIIVRAPLPPATAATAFALVIVLAIGGAGLYVAIGPALPGGTQKVTSSAPVGNLDQATLEIDAGAASVHVQGSTSLSGDLYQAQILYSGPAPTVTFDQQSGHVVIEQRNAFAFLGTRSMDVSVQVNVAVPWTFVAQTGASTQTYGLANVDVRSMEIDTGASTETVALGSPKGSVPIDINGGALTVHMSRAGGAAASVDVSGGAVSLDFDGSHHSAIGSISESTDARNDMFVVHISGGRCTVTMQASAPLD